MAGFAWWIWAVAALAIALAELHAPGSYMLWIGIGAAITAGWIASGHVAALEPQLIVFAIAAAASCVLGWFVYRMYPRRPTESALLNRRAQQMVGARAIVSEPFVNGEGKVRVGDSQWLAEGPSLREGTAVVVTAVRGARLVVREAATSA